MMFSKSGLGNIAETNDDAIPMRPCASITLDAASARGLSISDLTIWLYSREVVIVKRKATLAQLVERLIRNQQVAGSIPAGGSSFSMP